MHKNVSCLSAIFLYLEDFTSLHLATAWYFQLKLDKKIEDHRCGSQD